MRSRRLRYVQSHHTPICYIDRYEYCRWPPGELVISLTQYRASLVVKSYLHARNVTVQNAYITVHRGIFEPVRTRCCNSFTIKKTWCKIYGYMTYKCALTIERSVRSFWTLVFHLSDAHRDLTQLCRTGHNTKLRYSIPLSTYNTS